MLSPLLFILCVFSFFLGLAFACSFGGCCYFLMLLLLLLFRLVVRWYQLHQYVVFALLGVVACVTVRPLAKHVLLLNPDSVFVLL